MRGSLKDKIAKAAQHGAWWEEAEQYFDATLVGFDGEESATYHDKMGRAFTLTGSARLALERFLDQNSAGG